MAQSEEKQRDPPSNPRVLVVGSSNVGKSSIVKLLTGEEVKLTMELGGVLLGVQSVK